MPGVYDRKDSFYQKAKQQGYRSRAAYKLLELDKKSKLFKKGMRVLDLGCSPGSWTQVAMQKVGQEGLVLGIDLEKVEAITNGDSEAVLVQGDICEQETQKKLYQLADGKFDAVISDLSPKLSGIKFADAARSVELVEVAFSLAKSLLKENGTFVAKIFPSEDSNLLAKELRGHFRTFSRSVLNSTRKSSKEFYFVGKGFKKQEG